MAVTLFPPASTSFPIKYAPEAAIVNAGSDLTVRIPLATTNYLLSAQALSGAGIYRIRGYNAGTAYTSLAVLTWQQINGSFANVGSPFGTQDTDSGNTYGVYSEMILNVTNQVGWQVQSNVADTIMVIQKLSFTEAADFFSVVQTVTTSGTISLAQSASCILLGGGGGGAGGVSYPTGGGGGGAGYQANFSLAAGTYTLVLGAGGASNSPGGQSSIGGFTANGGNNGGGFGGGAGGSGGGSGGRGGGNGGGGGANGGNGANNSDNNGGPGSGSGVGLTGKMGLTAGGGGGGGYYGGAGGLYGGGGGAQAGVGGSAGAGAYAAGGGGGGGGQAGGTGGPGVFYYLRGF